MKKFLEQTFLGLIFGAILTLGVFGVINYANAEEEVVPKLSVPNGVQGHVYLTVEPCGVYIPEALAQDRRLLRAYATHYEGTPQEQVYEGCWSLGIPPDSEVAYGAIPVVNIFTPDGTVYTQAFGDFRPHKEEGPPKVEI